MNLWPKQFGAEVNLTPETVRLRLRALNLDTSPKRVSPRGPPDTVAEIHRLRSQGVTIREIAATVGLAPSTVYRMLSTERDPAEGARVSD